MGKIILLALLFFTRVYAQETQVQKLENKCLSCHAKQQIPSELIYRRYLMRYSTKDAVAEAMLRYLKNPKKETSIMPSQFFLKFPMKQSFAFSEEILRENISSFIDMFDVKKKLVLPNSF
jgi:hypothetical protein